MNLIKSGTKVLVTGAGGFIGSHLTEALVEKGCSVRALVKYNSRQNWGHLEFLAPEIKSKLEIISGDIQDPFCALEITKDCDVVFHLAALIGIPYSYHSPMSYVNTNVKGTLHMLQAAKTAKVKRFVHTSTSEAYGTALYTPIDEKHPLQGQSPYSASKIGADKLVESYGLSFDLPVVTLRPFNTYGPRQSARAIIPTIISQIAAGEKKIKLGSLSPVRDLTYVKDTAQGFIAVADLAMSKGVNQVFNTGSGKAISIGELATRIIKMMDVDVSIVSDESRIRPEGSEVMKLLCNSEKIKQETGWAPQTSLDKGLNETINYVKKNLEHYKPGLYAV